MDELFGLSMTWIMLALVALLGVALATVLYVMVRSRVMFFIGLRNMPRRMAQSVLIVVGLMLSTLIISAAFTTGDTVDHSLSVLSYDLLGHTDEWVQRFGEGDEAPIDVQVTMGADLVAEVEEVLDASLNVDGYAAALIEPVPALNPSSRQSEPSLVFLGVDETALDAFPDIISTSSGDVLALDTLAPDQVYLNDSGADELDAQPGDTIQVFVRGETHEFEVVDVVEDKLLTGVGDFGGREGVVTRLPVAQELFQQRGEVSFIAVSNDGGVRDGLGLTSEVVEDLERGFGAGLAQPAVEVYDVKRDLVEGSEEAGNFMATFFLILGLFSISAGMLLIVMIFVMLAAERKSELGMARAIGTRRSHLVQMFLSEGMAYNILSAAVGAALGVLVAFGITSIMARLFSEFGFSIETHVTARSLIISYSLGVVLTFLTVTFASWRVSNLNIVAAIRDLSDSKKVNPEEGTLRGYLRGVLNATVAVLTFPVGPLVLMLRGHTFGYPQRERTVREGIPIWPFVVLPLAPFYLIALALVRLTRDRAPGGLAIWAALLGIVLPPVGLVIAALQPRDRPIAWSTGVATLGIVFGGLLVVTGLSGDAAFPFALGCTIIAYGVALVLNYFVRRERVLFTSAGVFLLLFWGFTAGNRLEFLFGRLEGDIEMFFLSGVAMVASATFILVYNSDIFLGVVGRFGNVSASALPILRTAISYPLANRFRTGMTLAMIGLVIFALTMMSAMTYNFERLFLDDSARGGWDVVVDENPNNPIDDLSAALEAEGASVQEGFRAQGRIQLTSEAVVVEVTEGEVPSGDSYPVFGVDDGFVTGGEVPLGGRARGFDSDEEVWSALQSRGDVAVVDAFTLGGGGLFADDSLSISGIDSDAEVFDPITLMVADGVTGARARVEVIGVVAFGASASFFGVYIPEETFTDVFGAPLLSRHYVGLEPGSDAKDAARQIEAALLTTGVQSESIREQIEDGQALTQNFFRLMQGFMGLGLFVGIAAVGVIAFRTVVERRQQIGMLRAIGYKRRTVALSFILESAFVTLLGIVCGVGLAIWLSYFLVTSNEFPNTDISYGIPWLQIILIAGLTFVASLLMTYIPSRQAASVPTAEALRYE